METMRMTLLLGPPASGKTTLLLALAGKLDKRLRVTGRITYCGHELSEFFPQRTCAYISQHDLHNGEMTVRETLDFSGRCLGVGTRYEMLAELSRREKEAGIKPDPEIDAFMKATALEGQETNLVTDYILKILGLDICADIIVGNEMRKGISGGQKKRLTTEQQVVDRAINDICILLKCNRHNLNVGINGTTKAGPCDSPVVSVGKGLVIGWLMFLQAGRKFDCMRSPSTGHPIPMHVEEVEEGFLILSSMGFWITNLDPQDPSLTTRIRDMGYSYVLRGWLCSSCRPILPAVLGFLLYTSDGSRSLSFHCCSWKDNGCGKHIWNFHFTGDFCLWRFCHC